MELLLISRLKMLESCRSERMNRCIIGCTIYIFLPLLLDFSLPSPLELLFLLALPLPRCFLRFLFPLPFSFLDSFSESDSRLLPITCLDTASLFNPNKELNPFSFPLLNTNNSLCGIVISGRGVGRCTGAAVTGKGARVGEAVAVLTTVGATVGKVSGSTGLSMGGLSGQSRGGFSASEQIPSRIQSVYALRRV